MFRCHSEAIEAGEKDPTYLQTKIDYHQKQLNIKSNVADNDADRGHSAVGLDHDIEIHRQKIDYYKEKLDALNREAGSPQAGTTS